MAEERKVVLTKMAAICSRREYCESDVRDKISKYSLKVDDVEYIIDTLKREHYLDNFRYSVAYARDKSTISGWGAKKIEFFLKRKGISTDDINAALMEVDSSCAQEKMEEVISRKWRQLEGEGDTNIRRVKVLKFAMGRGYHYDQVYAFLKQLSNAK